jgi:hypothetical protein
VDHADAAAVQAAVESATGQGGGEEAEKPVTLRDVLGDASAMVPARQGGHVCGRREGHGSLIGEGRRRHGRGRRRRGGGCAGAIDVMLHCRDANNYSEGLANYCTCNYWLRVRKNNSRIAKFLINNIYIYSSKLIYFKNIFYN